MQVSGYLMGKLEFNLCPEKIILNVYWWGRYVAIGKQILSYVWIVANNLKLQA